MIAEKVKALLSEKFSEKAFSDCFLIGINHSNKKLEVFIDSDTGVTFETCKQVSRFLEHYIDEEGWLGEKYVLEVSSPGVDRPLLLRRQYPKHLGRKLEVTTEAGKAHVGTLEEIGEDHITIEEKVRIKQGKRKKTELIRTEIPFDQIKKAIVKVTF